MPHRALRYHRPAAAGTVVDGGVLATRFAAIRADLDVPDGFPQDVLDEATAAATTATMPDRDERDVEFLTIDPPGSTDLDQALALDRDGSCYRVRYAIADVPAFVSPGGRLDAEARRRGQTIYLPDGRAPLHPAVLGDDAASLLPAQDRPAYVWDVRLDEAGVVAGVAVYRAMVRSRRRLDYAGVQETVDAGVADPVVVVLREIGTRRVDLEGRRGGASLPMPEQDVVQDPDGTYRLSFRPPVPVEDWNAQLSLLTGMAAAELMIDAGVGILRTMPPPDRSAVRRLRRQATALGVDWPTQQRYGEFLRGLDRTDPAHVALGYEAASLFRGAGYTPVVSGQAPVHAALAAPYAHVTAPLRRLVDRFALVVCEAISQGRAAPDWAVAALPELPALMADSDRRAGAVERACTDAVEAAALAGRVGQDFAAVVVDEASGGRVLVQLLEPAIVARAAGTAPPGTEVRVRVAGADVATGTLTLEVVD